MELEQPVVSYDDWIKRIRRAETKMKKWRKEAKDYVKSYEGGREDEATDLSDFNILFSNTETLRSAIYNKPPTPRVVQRFKDNNSAARNVAEVLERAISFTIDEEETDSVVRASVQEALLTGFSTIRVRYSPKMVQRPATGMDGLPAVDEMGQPVMEEVIGFQEVELEEVDYDRIIWDCDEKWENTPFVSFEHRFTSDEMTKNFGLAKEQYQKSEFKGESGENAEHLCKVYEVWDKEKKQFFFLIEGYTEPMNVQPDPLGLDDFFPIPKPLQFIRGRTSKPIPEYRIYKNQAEKLANLAARKSKIVKFIKATGVYDSSNKELADILTGADGEMYPAQITSFDKGVDVSGSFALLPVDGFAKVLAQLEMSIQESKQVIYEVTGISDIMRGATIASETATAQNIKGKFGTMRVQDRQKEVARFVRDIVRMIGEIIAKHFEPQILTMMTGKEVGDAELKIMRDDSVRVYTIDIEDESTIQVDEEEEKKNAVDLLTAVGTYMTTMGPLVQPNGMVPFNVAKELLMIAVRRFKGARSFEEVLDTWQAPVPNPPAMPQVLGGQEQPMEAPMA